MTTSHEEIEAVRANVTNVAHHIDEKRWNELRALYANFVETDYTSLFGGTPQKQSGSALIAGWRGALEKVTTQHLLGPIDVRLAGSVATARCHVRAMHYAEKAASGRHWEVLGHYLFDLALEGVVWKITRMKLETFLQTGNPKLLAEV